jgi:hypothetical protein
MCDARGCEVLLVLFALLALGWFAGHAGGLGVTSWEILVIGWSCVGLIYEAKSRYEVKSSFLASVLQMTAHDATAVDRIGDPRCTLQPH